LPPSVGLLELLATAPSFREHDAAAAVAVAAALPALVRVVGAARWPALRPALEAAADVDAPAVRAALVGGLAALAAALGPELAERDLLPLLDVRPCSGV